MEVSDQLHAPAALPSREGPMVPIGLETGRAPEQVWTRRWRGNFPALAGIWTPDYPARSTALYHWIIHMRRILLLKWILRRRRKCDQVWSVSEEDPIAILYNEDNGPSDTRTRNFLFGRVTKTDKEDSTRVYPKVSGLTSWSENCKWHSSLPLGAVVSLFC
jgi:hypothetical protein